jgi:hypothetical protein
VAKNGLFILFIQKEGIMTYYQVKNAININQAYRLLVKALNKVAEKNEKYQRKEKMVVLRRKKREWPLFEIQSRIKGLAVIPYKDAIAGAAVVILVSKKLLEIY